MHNGPAESRATTFRQETDAFDQPIALAGTLTAWIAASETLFLAVGERLQGVHARVSVVRAGIGRTTEILATTEMTEMGAGLSSALESSRGVSELVRERGAALSTLRSAIDTAASGSAAVRLVFRTLDYVTLIARAQIGGMADGQDELVPFAAHVDELVASGEKVARFIDERMAVLVAALEESHAIEAQASASGAEEKLVEGFAELTSLIGRQQTAAGERRTEAQEAFTAVWKAIGGVVMGLQAHDMARQRFEHTARNLALLDGLVREGYVAEGIEPLPAQLRTAAVRRVLRLEIAQIDDLAETYGEKMGALDADLAVIADQLDACAAVLDRLRPTDAGDEGLGALESQASRLRLGFREGEATRLQLCVSLERSVEATSSLIEMTDKLSDLEYDLSLAGFNAAVRAAHVSGGDETIGYIASVIREQAAKAREEADEVRRGIETAIASTGRLSGEILPAVTLAEQAIEAALGSTSKLLAAAEADCRATLDESAAAAAGLSGEIAAVREMMRSHGEGHQMMRALSAAIVALAADLPDGDLPAEEAERLDRHLVAAYTMEEERTVFVKAIGPMPTSSATSDSTPAATPATGADDLDDIFF